MASRVTGENMVELTCDTCGAHAPPAVEILKNHGLNRMGWHCSGGVHICPNCVTPEMAKGPKR